MQKYIQNLKTWYEKMKMSKISYEVTGINPTRDWQILIIVTVLLMIIFGGLSFYFYMKIDKGEIFTLSQSQKDKELKIDDKLLKQAVDDISLRKRNLDEIKSSKSTPSDPSI